MRIFKKYSPLLIAKYVSSFFKGQFQIQGLVGVFTFDRGKVLISSDYSGDYMKVCKEVNAQIASFSRSYS